MNPIKNLYKETTMTESEKLKLYLQKIEKLATDSINERKTPALQAIKEALNFIEGEMIGY